MKQGARLTMALLAALGTCVLPAALAAAAPGQVLVDGTQTEIEVQLAEAEAVFFSADQPDSISLFDALIEQLEQRVDGTGPEAGSLLLRSLAYRAQAHHNLGDEPTARADLERMLLVDPTADVDRDVVSPKFTELFDAVRAEIIGYLSVLIAPPDATLWLDGEVVDWATGTLALRAGTHTISVERLGFDAHQMDVEVAAGESTPVETILGRTSAVATFTLLPTDAAVQLDGSPATLAAGRPGASDVSDSPSLSLAGLEVGEHRIHVSRDGYRPRTHVFRIDELADFDLGSLALERAVGTIALSNFPEGAAVDVDGAAVTVQPAKYGTARLELSPGTHTIEISAGRRGMFVATVEVIDREETLIEVRPRPSVAFLGVLGEDDLGSEILVRATEYALAGHPLWMWQDRASGAEEILAGAGLNSSNLRAAAGPAREQIAAARQRIAQSIEASAYVLAVLDDDLVATRVDLWIWPSPPGPAAVQRMSFALDGGRLGDELQGAFSIDLAKHRAYLGAQLIDSPASPFPTVIAIASDGPAASAGIEIGDEVSAIDGTAVGSVEELHRAIVHAGAGEVALQVRRRGAEVTMGALLAESAEVVLPGMDDVPYGLMWAAAEAHSFLAENPAPDWVLGLDQAAVLLHTRQWEEAVRLLRTVRAPVRSGVGQGMVDYWLGLALLQLGPDYRDHARRAFESAAAVDGATLGHDDGPMIGPLVRALLAALGS